MAIYWENSEDDGDVSPSEELTQTDNPILPSDLLEFEPLVSMDSLTGISTLETLNLILYIKH
jgi:hypothetical protein